MVKILRNEKVNAALTIGDRVTVIVKTQAPTKNKKTNIKALAMKLYIHLESFH